MPELEDVNDDTVFTEVPVVDPNKTVTNWVGIVTAVTSFIVLMAKAFGVPFTEADMEMLMSAAGVLVGLFVFTKNRWYTAEATAPTAVKKGLKLKVKKPRVARKAPAKRSK